MIWVIIYTQKQLNSYYVWTQVCVLYPTHFRRDYFTKCRKSSVYSLFVHLVGVCAYMSLPKLCHNLFFILFYSIDCDFCKICALISCVNSNTKMHFLFILKILLCWRYARQVAEFFEFVKKKKEVPSAEAGEGATSSQPQLLMPHHKGGLWVPGGKHFPESALKSLDFRRAMSSFMSG